MGSASALAGLVPALTALLAATCLIVVHSARGTPITLVEDYIAQDQHARHRTSPSGHPLQRVPSKVLLGDLRKVLLDVETDIKYRAEQRREQKHRTQHSEHHKKVHKAKDLHEVDHMMDGLEQLAGHRPSRGRDRDRDRERDSNRDRQRRKDAETRIILGDFKKVTGFGKKAGYVPPPKIPAM